LMNRVKGHEKGSQTVRSIVTAARELGIGMLTLYAFSTENWARPKIEVSALMMLLKRFLVSERDELMTRGVRLNILGQKDKLPKDVREEAEKTVVMTRNNQGMGLNLALSYGSRQEITLGVKSLARKIKAGSIQPGEITEEMISDHLYTRQMPDPDLIIRTSGELRLSNFMLWQAAYSELFITNTLWPDFTREEFIEILINFQERDRRFGKVKCSTSNDGSPQ
ncbi:MAG: di-trans,poly-cis-decaprenylcistransferase, partial [Desulfobacteraceae bacterium]|nr:di-trans,poly-cis-decaprenylcistransferase [Desulfobacteraceae bacterium]